MTYTLPVIYTVATELGKFWNMSKIKHLGVPMFQNFRYT